MGELFTIILLPALLSFNLCYPEIDLDLVCLFIYLFIEGPLSGITLSSQNAGSEELAQRSVPDVLQCGESTVPALTHPCDLEHPLAAR